MGGGKTLFGPVSEDVTGSKQLAHQIRVEDSAAVRAHRETL
jgi:hypothetical protein